MSVQRSFHAVELGASSTVTHHTPAAPMLHLEQAERGALKEVQVNPSCHQRISPVSRALWDIPSHSQRSRPPQGSLQVRISKGARSLAFSLPQQGQGTDGSGEVVGGPCGHAMDSGAKNLDGRVLTDLHTTRAQELLRYACKCCELEGRK